ncbi:MAG: hypothetical protein ACU836_15760 [Gammaproteobacteria bacterium]
MNKLAVIIPGLLTVTLTACGNNDEEVTYQDDQTKVTVNQETGTSTIKTTDGENKVEATFQQGGALPLPSDFPSDVPLPPGAVLEANIHTEEVYSLKFKTSQPSSELGNYYNDQLTANGWDITATTSMMGMTMVVGEKEGRTCQIHIAEEDGQTMLMINLIKSES